MEVPRPWIRRTCGFLPSTVFRPRERPSVACLYVRCPLLRGPRVSPGGKRGQHTLMRNANLPVVDPRCQPRVVTRTAGKYHLGGPLSSHSSATHWGLCLRVPHRSKEGNAWTYQRLKSQLLWMDRVVITRSLFICPATRHRRNLRPIGPPCPVPSAVRRYITGPRKPRLVDESLKNETAGQSTHFFPESRFASRGRGVILSRVPPP